jgi:hypothetical protein
LRGSSTSCRYFSWDGGALFHPTDAMDAEDVVGAQHADYLVNRVLLTPSRPARST